jgi:hypothetical protein
MVSDIKCSADAEQVVVKFRSEQYVVEFNSSKRRALNHSADCEQVDPRI